MSTKNTLSLREGSSIDKAYNLIKDGKSHKLSAIRATLKKAGVKKQLVILFRLNRLMLKNKTGKGIVIDYTKDIVQMKPAAQVKGNVRNGNVREINRTKKVVAKKPVTKKKTVAKPVAKKSNAKARVKAATKTHSKAVKQVVAAIADGLEE